MFKAFIFGLLAGCVLIGVAWFVAGRSNVADIRATVERFDKDLGRSEQLVNQFGDDLGRYTGTFSVRVDEAVGLRDSIGQLREEFSGYVPEIGNIKSELTTISDGIATTQKSVQRIVVINRDFADILHEYRRLSETSGKEE